MPRPRRCCPKRERRWPRRWSCGPIRRAPTARGASAKAALERARATIAEALGWTHDILFTSGASEAVGIAAARALPPRRLVGATEHDVVPYHMGEEATVLPVDRAGSDPSRRSEARFGGRAGAGRGAAGQQRDGSDSTDRGDRRSGPRRRGAAARRLRAVGGQDRASRRRLHRHFRPQVRRAAGNRRAAGQGPGDARSIRRAGKRAIAAARRIFPALREWRRHWRAARIGAP